MRIFSLIALLFFMVKPYIGNAQAAKKQAPNVLMICVDDLNDFIGGMGHKDALTPNIDQLIASGTLFGDAQCQAPLCGPSRASILTGLRPSTTGIYGMIGDNDLKSVSPLTKAAPLLHQYFKDNGYYTMGVGKIYHHHAPDGLLDESGGGSGYGPLPAKRFNWNKKGTGTDWGAFPEKEEDMPDDAAVIWTVERLNRNYEKPFFLSVGFIRPHVPWYVPKKWFDLYDPAKLQLPAFLKTDRDDLPPIALKVDDFTMMPSTQWAIENNQWRNIIQAYLACVSYADHNIGTVLNALKKSKHAENTIIVLWSDHGYRLGEKNTFAKVSLWDRATKAPLIFAGPGIPANQKVKQPVELLSVYPTLTDLCKLPENQYNEGHSLLPLIKNPSVKWSYPTITTWGRNNHAVKTKDYRYIRYEDGAEELYILKTDPNEWYNVAKDKKNLPVINTLKRNLPRVNKKWSAASFYNASDYFERQKLEQVEEN